MKWGAVLSGGAVLSNTFIGRLLASKELGDAATAYDSVERMVRVGCPSHNCGGRCLLKVFVKT